MKTTRNTPLHIKEKTLSKSPANTPISSKLLLDASAFLCQTEKSNPHLFSMYLSYFGDKKLPPEKLSLISSAVPIIVQHPTTPMDKISKLTDINPSELLGIYMWMQGSKMLKTVLTSHYYPNYMMMRYAQTFLDNLVDNPQYLEDIIEERPVSPKRLEVHVTNGTCNYRCTMCLWHVKGLAKYENSNKLLTTKTWNKVFDQAKEMGTEVIIFSGGGEPLLRQDIGESIEHANKIGLYTMIYTNGSQLEKMSKNSQLYKAILNSDWLRISLHATTNATYARLVHLPEKTKPLDTVVRGIKNLIKDRDKLKAHLKIGIGFVTQHENYKETDKIARLAKKLGVDMLNIREDCIDITKHLSPNEKNSLYQKLRNIRTDIDRGEYGNMDIDFADTMIAPMNNWTNSPYIETSRQCRVHLYRSAIDPYGRVAVCDLVSEPFFATDELTLGYISSENDYLSVLKRAAKKKFMTNKCSKCMPGQKSINALWFKILEDIKQGVNPEDQPFLFDKDI